MTPPTLPPTVAVARERARRDRARVCAIRDQLRHVQQELVIARRCREVVIVCGDL